MVAVLDEQVGALGYERLYANGQIGHRRIVQRRVVEVVLGVEVDFDEQVLVLPRRRRERLVDDACVRALVHGRVVCDKRNVATCCRIVIVISSGSSSGGDLVWRGAGGGGRTRTGCGCGRGVVPLEDELEAFVLLLIVAALAHLVQRVLLERVELVRVAFVLVEEQLEELAHAVLAAQVQIGVECALVGDRVGVELASNVRAVVVELEHLGLFALFHILLQLGPLGAHCAGAFVVVLVVDR